MGGADKSHDMLVMWMDLNRAIGTLKRSRPGAARAEIVPWTCTDQAVKRAWRRITAPGNLRELEKRLKGTCRERKRLWTQRAVEECRERLKMKQRRP